ncbi:hypothetical protein MKD41_06030 [Lutibacter sp. A64]|uniref:hypothetical protein n=1 Tax=Lutibacter sp. A64 TaxID=2918526 RepID=UPI001F06CA7C|nr:hypothetical protein [Lutibacter sp. A64]UMB55030.1 hypothetical protein MKD41_06030 [Lutibacter sp. A64]
MKFLKFNYLTLFLICIILSLVTSCKTSKSIKPDQNNEIQLVKQSGGSSGMEKLDDDSYLVVYDIKSYKTGARLAILKITEEGVLVSPITISEWGDEGLASDLESICKIPGKTDEYFIAESGNWKGEIGRIFHIKVDVENLMAKILGITKLPLKNINNLEVVGDQYEAIVCLPYNENKRILILAERGGSKVNPNGIVRWGVYNLQTHQLNFSDVGLQGIEVQAPGNWTNNNAKRAITDLHIDAEGGIWAAASEDISDAGPFYSVIYKIGQVDLSNEERPFKIYTNFSNWEVISGFKVEALSGSTKSIKATHSFGTEDEVYGGVWRPITIE